MVACIFCVPGVSALPLLMMMMLLVQLRANECESLVLTGPLSNPL